MQIIGVSLSKPHHMTSAVKSVFLHAYYVACLLDPSSLIWLKAVTSNTWSAIVAYWELPIVGDLVQSYDLLCSWLRLIGNCFRST